MSPELGPIIETFRVKRGRPRAIARYGIWAVMALMLVGFSIPMPLAALVVTLALVGMIAVMGELARYAVNRDIVLYAGGLSWERQVRRWEQLDALQPFEASDGTRAYHLIAGGVRVLTIDAAVTDDQRLARVIADHLPQTRDAAV